MQAGRGAALAVVALMLVVGALTLTQFQTQQLFRDSRIAFQEGTVPRNDGAILAASVLLGAGVGLFLALTSSRPPRERIVPSVAAAAAVMLLVGLNFTIFVNSIIIPSRAEAHFTASFAFRHSPFVEPLHVLIPALASVMLLGVVTASAWFLAAGRSFPTHFGARAAPEAQRAVVLVAGLLLTGTLLFFLGAFVRSAVDLEAVDQTGEHASTVLLYYLLALAILLLALVVVAKTSLLVWRHAWFPQLAQPMRAVQSLTVAETWMLAMVVLLDVLVLATTGPGSPAGGPLVYGDVVFVYTDRGVAFLLLLAVAPYVLYATAARWARSALRAPAPHGPPRRQLDANARYALAALSSVLAVALLTANTGMGNLPRILLATGALAAVTGARALRFRMRDGVPYVAVRREAGAFALAFVALAWATGLMLWGMGNTVEAEYVTNGEVVSLTDATYQRFSVAFRFLGSLSFAVPTVLALDATTRWLSPRKLGPLVLVLFGLLSGTHLLFPIAYETPFDADLGTTDVMVGYASVAQETFTRNVVLVVWSALAFAVVVSAARILGVTRPSDGRPSAVA